MDKFKVFFRYFTEVIRNRRLLLKLVNNDLKAKNSGSFLGVIWVYIQPLVTISVFWYVFQVGFKTSPVNNVKFIVWFVAAYVPWIYFNDSVMASSNCLYEYSYLVKKIKFKTSLLPLVKVLSASYIHIFFMAFTFFIYLIYGYDFKIAWFNIIYYSFCLFALNIGLSWIVSSISVFVKDFSQFINILLQIGFWLTPIFWNPDTMSDKVMAVLKFNPIYYIVIGYRSCLINGISFWERGPITIYFWCITGMVLILGALIFGKLRDHFADIL